MIVAVHSVQHGIHGLTPGGEILAMQTSHYQERPETLRGRVAPATTLALPIDVAMSTLSVEILPKID